ncbi:unnamed protein product [Anisakis simplex]|uniref:RICTOR_N domain-containing protein n=1 Tax=Anisakis simplex TaxID=6269 RepID=A0A0M3JPR6_ANISI|nr:unnamed protein product [Anisakis simplex]
MASLFDGAEQLSCAVDLLEYIVELGGDSSELSGNSTGLNTSSSAQKNKRAASSSSSSTPIFSNLVFDRSKHSVQKLRHYRFTLIGWIARLLSSQQLLDKVRFSLCFLVFQLWFVDILFCED